MSLLVRSVNLIDSITQNKEFKYLIETKIDPNDTKKKCLIAQITNFTNDKGDGKIMGTISNSCQLFITANVNTFFTLAGILAEAAFKEELDIKYYWILLNDTLKGTSEYMDKTVSLAVSILIKIIF